MRLRWRLRRSSGSQLRLRDFVDEPRAEQHRVMLGLVSATHLEERGIRLEQRARSFAQNSLPSRRLKTRFSGAREVEAPAGVPLCAVVAEADGVANSLGGLDTLCAFRETSEARWPPAPQRTRRSDDSRHWTALSSRSGASSSMRTSAFKSSSPPSSLSSSPSGC